MDSLLYTLSETVHKQNYAVATYHISLPKEVDVLKKAAALAVGQTIGTWIPIPGITEEIREKYMGKVVNVFDVPSLDLATQITGDQSINPLYNLTPYRCCNTSESAHNPGCAGR